MSEIKIHYPVVIPTLNRYEHLKRCIGSLAKNTGAEETELIVGLDYPPSEKYQEGYAKIKEYLPSVKGFKNVIILEADKNLGAVENSKKIRRYAQYLGYEAYIYTEDDNEFSPNFLEYINWALVTFKNDKSINSICGYNLINSDFLENNVYKYNHGFCAWGCGRWFDRIDKEKQYFSLENLRRIVDEASIKCIFSKRVMLFSSLLYMIKHKELLGDTVIQVIPDEERYCIFPKISKVRNYGHDGSGLHGGSKESYQRHINEIIDAERSFIPQISGELHTDEIDLAYDRKYKIEKIPRLLAMIKFIIYRLSGKIFDFRKPKFLKKIRF